MSRLVTSLPSVPQFQQGRLQTFACHAKILDVLLHLFSRGFAVFHQKRERPSAIERRQSLNDVVPADDGLVIRSGEFVDGAGPQLISKKKIIFFESGDSLQLSERWWRKNRLQYSFQFSHAGAKHAEEPFPVYPQGLEGYFLCCAESGDGLRIVFRAPDGKVGFERPEQGTHGLAHGCDQVGSARVNVRLDAEKRLRQAEAPGNGRNRQGNFRTGLADFMSPDFLPEKMTGQLPGEGKFRRVRLPDLLAVEGARHGVNQVAHQQSVKFMAGKEGRNEIKTPL